MPGAQMCPRQGATVSVLLYVRLVHVPCTCTWLSISVSCERVSLDCARVSSYWYLGRTWLIQQAISKRPPGRCRALTLKVSAVGKCLSLGSTAVQPGEGRGQQA